MRSRTHILILVRGESKRIPEKNLQTVGDESLLATAIKTGKNTGLPVVVSSDSDKLLEIAHEHEVETLQRPDKLATDTATSVAATIHACDALKLTGSVVLLQVTNPFVRPEDIQRAVLVHERTGKAVFAAQRHPQSLQAWSYDAPLFPVCQEVRSQDLPPVFLPAGAFFVQQVKYLRREKSFFRPAAIPFEIPSERIVDIDTPEDLEFARFKWARLAQH